jgi:tetratricopeptide (TPR) repeat protein
MPPGPILLKRVPAFFAAIADYLRIFFIPIHLHAEYSYRMFSFFEPKVLAGISITIFLLCYAFIRRKSDNLMFFSVYWFFIGLLPVSNIYPISDSYMAERWFYFPSLALIIILAEKLKCLLERKNIRLYVVCLWIFVVFLFSCLTVKQSDYWKEPVAFYKRTVEYNPGNWKMYNQLALQYAKLGNFPAAEEAYKKALKIKPYEVNIYYNLWLLYNKAGEKEKAAAVYSKAEQLKKDLFLSYVELGNKYSSLGKDRETVAPYTKALELIPGNQEVTIDLADAYLIIGKYENSIALLEKVISVNPRLALAHNNLAVAYYYNKNYKLAILHCDEATRLGYVVKPFFLEHLKPYRK